ncbi:hypothetical protein LQ327_10525 [Actinomycetospora endophytica]|uniref:ClpA/ClpB-like protein n=1 Tax=Actinomycetospora endophytica TaxID=2291215 RepID=A0ABS8P9X6_9PSEU|nr:Clp protease N-terminal domain-containing protein [Actinomycetospora endophytica]MCD2193809.1 hypothetical protein [Actinomycetospora endophytica]
MTVTPIFDDLTAHGAAVEDPAARRTMGGGIVVAPARRPSPVPRPGPEDATAFGQGCLDDDRPAAATIGSRPADDVLVGLVEAARREVAVLGHGRVGTEHLLLAVVRGGGEVGRAFGLRRAGAAVIAAACADGPTPGELLAPDGAAGLSTSATAALDRARRRAAAHGRPCRPTDLALGLLEAGRSATLLAVLGIDRDDLADVLGREDLALPVTAPARADVRPDVPAPTPVGTVAPVALMLPGAPVVPDATAPLRIGPPPGSPALRGARGRVDRPRLDRPA